MAPKQEVEIKFRVDSPEAVSAALRRAGFEVKTPRTHEVNTLYDLPSGVLRRRGEILRLREYGESWKLTHKAKGKAGLHKSRAETETAVEDGRKMDGILRALGYLPSFRYEKFRAEWTDGSGDVVLDETPIGNLGEIEGPARWIDRVAKQLGISRDKYITQSYAELFLDWKKRTRVPAEEMTFRAVRAALRRKP
ncbi:MAG: class IV adenylate cyclase [Acidobacteriales bacterium]|nr:class IV adenylate cyclase [Terriglobales bacterium]